jgi:hypothetical protein
MGRSDCVWAETDQEGLLMVGLKRYGIALRSNIDSQQVLPWVWQAGGEIMSADGKTAQIDTPEFKRSYAVCKGPDL